MIPGSGSSAVHGTTKSQQFNQQSLTGLSCYDKILLSSAKPCTCGPHMPTWLNPCSSSSAVLLRSVAGDCSHTLRKAGSPRLHTRWFCWAQRAVWAQAPKGRDKGRVFEKEEMGRSALVVHSDSGCVCAVGYAARQTVHGQVAARHTGDARRVSEHEQGCTQLPGCGRPGRSLAPRFSRRRRKQRRQRR